MRKFVALARVSSREQEREGFSLDVQVDVLRQYAERREGEIVKLFRVAETATKRDERKTFRELIEYVRANSRKLDGLLVYKLDRATRNLQDYALLEEVESDYGVPLIAVSQPTDNTPSGRLQRRIQASFAAYQTEQQGQDVREGLERRVKNGWFVTVAPFGYRNVRVDGRSTVEIDPDHGPKVQRIFDLYAYHGHTLDSLRDTLFAEGVIYKPSQPRFTRSHLHSILNHRAYSGDVPYHGDWLPGQHEPLIDRGTWQRVQTMLNQHVYRSHELPFAGELTECGHCGHPITGEAKTKRTKNGEKTYTYYRCARYNVDGHPRIRLPERELDEQMLTLLGQLRIEDDRFRQWFTNVLRARAKDDQQATRDRIDALNEQLRRVRQQLDRLIDLRVSDEIDEGTFSRKQTELRDQEAELRLQIEPSDKGRHELADLAVKAFELSQSLAEKWLDADHAVKRQILEIVCLNFRLDGASLVPEWRKPFDVLAEKPSVSSSRGDRI
ncbi:MAG: recombinase family protein [Planctomycetota bacterium]|nr:MAG: recombinase family protein [Planctomycetota bacterium]REK20502.1 MAG: recombinase family protein [Planctomycetota bacterium]REK28256.1 MAG: recombinase family protein [Planctomycetota bacterium]